jgi:peptide/nickel transport system substrate-binding protein
MVRSRARVRAAVALAAALAVLVTACSSSEPTDRRAANNPSASGGNMVAASTADAVSFHPYKTSDTASSEYQGLVYGGGMLDRDPQQPEKFIGNFAESWTIDPDEVTYTFTLRPNLVWSDGQPLTANDFEWTYQQASNPANLWPYVSNLENIESYAARDERTIVVKLKEPVAVGLEMADAISPPLPRHIWEKLDWNDSTKNPEINKPTVGSGPFLLKDWQRDSQVTIVPTERYFKGRPKLDSYTIRIAGNPTIAYQWLKTGEVDRSGFTPADYADAKRLSNVTVYEWWPATGNWSYLGFNLRRPVLQDVRVRQALAYAVDRNLIIERVLYGLAQPTYSAYGPTCWCYDPDVPHRDYDPERAKQLLDQAGWVPGADGIRQKDGQQLRLRLLFGPNSSRTREQIATVVQDSFKQVGVGIDIQGLEWNAYLAALRTGPFDWDMNVGGWRATVDPSWMYQIWSEENIPELNAGAYRNPEVETLFKNGEREMDQAKRKPIYDQIQKILVDDQPYIFLSLDLAYEGISNRIGGIRPSPLGLEWNIEEWYVR